MNPSRDTSAHRKFRARRQDRFAQGPVKGRRAIVGVIANSAALQQACRLRQPPDFFELRLDALQPDLAQVEGALPQLNAPLILTARHPAEDGVHNLPASARRQLLTQFLEHAAWLDLELRSAKILHSLGKEICRPKIGLILSHHDLRDTPSLPRLREQLQRARDGGADIFKIATRTDTPAQLDRLLAFFSENSARFPIAAMGFGALGPASRRQLFRLGSVLNYASIGPALLPGQLSLAQLRSLVR
ncbi:MAG TPA: type I 3-dehydroquinate dehydratase [Chthoniobacterales bacterium]